MNSNLVEILVKAKVKVRLNNDQLSGIIRSWTDKTFVFESDRNRRLKWNRITFVEPSSVRWKAHLYGCFPYAINTTICMSHVDEERFIIEAFSGTLFQLLREAGIGPMLIMPETRQIAFTNEGSAVIGRIFVDQIEDGRRRWMAA